MCYHTSSPSRKSLEQGFPTKKVDYSGENIYHISGFARPFLPVELNTIPNTIDAAQWKLLPFWVKNEDAAKKYANTLNAESETVFEKASYKSYINKYRGLLYVDGFYEPHKVAGQKDTDNYFIYQPEHKIFTLGIVVAPWTDQSTGELINTFSILTTPANELLSEIHNEKKRMPLIIGEDDRAGWLNASGKSEIQSYFKPYIGDLSSHRTIRVTGIRGGDTNFKEIQNEV